MTSLKDKTIFVTGGSRGIGLAMALRAARDGANIIIAAKTAEPLKLPAGARCRLFATSVMMARSPMLSRKERSTLAASMS